MAKAELNGGEMKEYKRLTKSGSYCGDEIDWEDVEEIYDRLAEFEDAIENGELRCVKDKTVLEMQLKVGDTVWLPNRIWDGDIENYPVIAVGKDCVAGEYFVVEDEEQEPIYWCDVKVGEDIFLTREQAEKTLFELEQDKTIKLPCNIGDTVYVITKLTNSGKWVLSNDYANSAHIVLSVYLNRNKPPKFQIMNMYGTVSLDDFGKTVFTTKAQAEAKLKELEGKK